MAQKKQHRFAAIKTFTNVFEKPVHQTAGQWAIFFKNKNPIVVELACGKGEYTLAMAARYPNKNFIGIDIKGNRIWRGAQTALQKNLTNVAFIRGYVEDITTYFAPAELSGIWIPFPDPQLKKEKKRLTHPRFLTLYQQVVQPQSPVHLKTDSEALYQFTQQIIEAARLPTVVNTAYPMGENPHLHDDMDIITHYEQLNISGSNKIFYLQFLIDPLITAPKND